MNKSKTARTRRVISVRTNYGEHFTDNQLAIVATLVNIVVPVMLVTCGMPRQAEQVHVLQVNRATFKSVSERIRTIHGRLHKASTKHSDAQFRAALAGIGAVDHALTAAFEVDDHTKEAMDKAFAAVDAAERAGAISTHDAGDLREDLNNAQAELHFRGVDFRGEYA